MKILSTEIMWNASPFMLYKTEISPLHKEFRLVLELEHPISIRSMVTGRVVEYRYKEKFKTFSLRSVLGKTECADYIQYAKRNHNGTYNISFTRTYDIFEYRVSSSEYSIGDESSFFPNLFIMRETSNAFL